MGGGVSGGGGVGVGVGCMKVKRIFPFFRPKCVQSVLTSVTRKNCQMSIKFAQK